MLDSQKIQSFFAVVEHRSLSSAALALRVSQPTLTRQMQGLESDFKTPLFLRSGRGMTLTEAGQRLYSGLQGIDRQLRSLREDVAASLIEPTGEVAVGIPPSPRRLIAVPLVQQFARANPRVTVRIVEETSGQLRDLVANGVLDIAITNSHEPMHGVSAEPLGREPLLLVGPRTAKLSMVKPIPLTALAQYPLILTNLPNSLRVIIETGLKVEGLQPNTRVVADALPPSDPELPLPDASSDSLSLGRASRMVWRTLGGAWGRKSDISMVTLSGEHSHARACAPTPIHARVAKLVDSAQL